MDLRALRYFIAVAEQQSFSKAAEAMGVVQSAISHSVRALEDETGVTLFTRTRRAVTLTEAGTTLRDDARRILQLADQAKSKLVQMAGGARGRLHIGFQGAACRRRVVSESLNDFRKHAPGIDLSLSPMSGLAMEDALQKGELDGGFFYFHGNDALTTRKLYTDDWLLALPHGHPLTSAKSVSLKDLRDEGFIVLPRKVTPILHDRIFAAFSARGLTPRVVLEAFEEPMVLNLVAVGLGIAFVLDSVPAELYGNVVLKPVKDFSVPTDLCFVWNAERVTPALNQFIKTLDGLIAPAPHKRCK